MSYSQLTYEQRYLIYNLLKIGFTQARIAQLVGVHRSTISRELRRNTGKRGYRFKQAQRIAEQRRNKAKNHQNPKINLEASLFGSQTVQVSGNYIAPILTDRIESKQPNWQKFIHSPIAITYAPEYHQTGKPFYLDMARKVRLLRFGQFHPPVDNPES